MEEELRKVRKWIKRNRVHATRLLQKLVQEGSVRGKEAAAQAIIIEKCRELGLQLDIWEIGDKTLMNHPAYCSDRKDYTGNPNVVGVLKGTGNGKSLILNGHIDVVPENNLAEWKNDPFSGLIEEGRLYGRGSTDMKGGTVALLLAMESIIAAEIQLKGDIIFQSVIEEESGGAGTLAAVLRGYRADGAIIPEPTNLKIFPKQQGSMWFRVTVKGRSAHGGTRYEGVNAIEKGILVINQLNELEKVRNSRIVDPLYKNIPIPIPINIGKIHSGDWPSSVPDICIIEGRIGVAPDEKMSAVQAELEHSLQELEKKDIWFKDYPTKAEWFGGRWIPGDLEIEHPLLTTLESSYREVMGSSPVIEASPWGTDGGVLSKIGDIPVVIFGPGVTEVAHDANEYIVLEDLFTSADIIATTILNWCEVSGSDS
jgi:acetylornithine deacetylase